eukprot:4075463-Amphidinium_carterae.1
MSKSTPKLPIQGNTFREFAGFMNVKYGTLCSELQKFTLLAWLSSVILITSHASEKPSPSGPYSRKVTS